MTVNIFRRERRPFRGNLVRTVAEARNLALDRYERKSPTFAWELMNQFDCADFSLVSHGLSFGKKCITVTNPLMSNYIKYIHFSSWPGLSRPSTSGSHPTCQPA